MSDRQYLRPLTHDELERLRESIRADGVLEPVVRDQDGVLVDGHHRAQIAKELGVECPSRTITVRDEREAEQIVIALNAHRRMLSRDEVVVMAKRRRELAAELRKKGRSTRAIAKETGVSVGQTQRDLSTVSPDTVPDRSVGLDGKSRPTKMPKPGDEITDDFGDTRTVTEVEEHGEEIIIHDDSGDALIRPNPVRKKDLGDGVSHPARFSDALLPVFARYLKGYHRILDPFAGTGRIHELMDLIDCETVGVEIEQEWVDQHPNTVLGDALNLPFKEDEFAAICTSPTYGNRLADHHNASDPERRRSYTHDLGRPLSENNSGSLHWGDEYKDFHKVAWSEAWRVIGPGGRFVLNIKDHIRNGEYQEVCGWHVRTLIDLGFEFTTQRLVGTPNLSQGTNADLRVPAEYVVVFDKP